MSAATLPARGIRTGHLISHPAGSAFVVLEVAYTRYVDVIDDGARRTEIQFAGWLFTGYRSSLRVEDCRWTEACFDSAPDDLLLVVEDLRDNGAGGPYRSI